MVGIRNLRNSSMNNSRFSYIIEVLSLDNPSEVELDDYVFHVDNNDNILVDSIYFGNYKIKRSDNFEYIEDTIDDTRFSYSNNKLLINSDTKPMEYYYKKLLEILKYQSFPNKLRLWRVRRGEPSLIEEDILRYTNTPETNDIFGNTYERHMYVKVLDISFCYPINN